MRRHITRDKLFGHPHNNQTTGARVKCHITPCNPTNKVTDDSQQSCQSDNNSAITRSFRQERGTKECDPVEFQRCKNRQLTAFLCLNSFYIYFIHIFIDDRRYRLTLGVCCVCANNCRAGSYSDSLIYKNYVLHTFKHRFYFNSLIDTRVEDTLLLVVRR